MNQNSIQHVIVSPEMTTLIGTGLVEAALVPAHAALLVFGFDHGSTLRIVADAAGEPLGDPAEGAGSISFIVQRAALQRLFDWLPGDHDDEIYHLPSDLRAIALRLRDCMMTGDGATAYRIGKSLELLCETVLMLASGLAVRFEGDLSFADSARLVTARQIIDERWAEKLSLTELARACGINRAKLTRGFRILYKCTIAEALAERRLAEASRALLTTDLPVASIGYASGYRNNASFSRAFGRRFGVSPSAYRMCSIAA